MFKRLSIVVFGICLPHLVHAKEAFYVLTPASADPNVVLGERLTTECNVRSILASRVFQQVLVSYPDSLSLKDPQKAGSRKTLAIVITAIDAAPGGPVSGPKSMTVRVELSADGSVIDTTTISELSGRGGVFGKTLQGTCEVLSVVSTRIGKNVTEWLRRSY